MLKLKLKKSVLKADGSYSYSSSSFLFHPLLQSSNLPIDIQDLTLFLSVGQCFDFDFIFFMKFSKAVLVYFSTSRYLISKLRLLRNWAIGYRA